MKTIFDKETRDGLISRINLLDENSKPQWGKMNVYQMLKHCTLSEEMYLGIKTYKRTFIGRLFGKVALNGMLRDDSPLGKNAPTVPHCKVTEQNGDVAAQKKQWIELVEEYGKTSKTDFEHSFFGKMTRKQMGQLAYKHVDHHLRQFSN
ncbi:DUF1569 domain-containing protein [Mucilaginibacter sp. cycad4]|uniref:DUF1569 domain-containing protein n=1 Tax=Mucilaginibacter sp. cycad4 TaxID=3342096 RepID=UPI002AAC3312|nr:DUF1569 domain-containing protein [Mucilaginibacter gossypii]WPV00376.1 DUF1569 domain-containing protein [Mucilaginibacter gossypii]